jgi:YHS domain-containing protein
MKWMAVRAMAFLLAAWPAAAQTTPVEALDGLDPVRLVDGKEVAGKADLKVVRGQFEYLFSSAETKALFERDPEQYEIQFGGACARMGGAAGNPSDYVVHNRRIYVFASDGCHKRFAQTPDKFIPPPAAPMPSSPAAAAEARTLIDRAIQALGGAAALDGLTSYVERATQVQPRPDGDVTIATTSTWRFPDHVRVDRTMTMAPGQSFASATVLTPRGAWFIGRGGQVFEMPSAGRAAAGDELGRNLVALLRSRSAEGVVAASLGRGTVAGVDVDRVRIRRGSLDVTLAVTPAGQVHSLGFVQRNIAGEFGACTLLYSDFRRVDDLTLPYTIRALFNGEPDPAQSRAAESIAVNAPVDPALFDVGGTGR